VFTSVFVCTVLECGTDAEEGWETVQRTNKTKFRPSPTSGPPSKTSVPARQADGDGRRSVLQLRRKEGNSRANVTASRQTEPKKQQCSASAVDIISNSSNFTKLSSLNATQQSKSSSHIGGSHGERGTNSSPRVMHRPATVYGSETVKSEMCFKTADIPTADEAREADSKLSESNVKGSGDRRLIAGCDDAVDSRLHDSLCDTVTRGKPSVRNTDAAVTNGLSSRTSSSMTEVRHSKSADIQLSSTDIDTDRHSFHLCRKSVSDDTLVERTVSGAHLLLYS